MVGHKITLICKDCTNIIYDYRKIHKQLCNKDSYRRELEYKYNYNWRRFKRKHNSSFTYIFFKIDYPFILYYFDIMPFMSLYPESFIYYF
jgi:hypothetical protein